MCAQKEEKTLAMSKKLDAHYMRDPWSISRVQLIKKQTTTRTPTYLVTTQTRRLKILTNFSLLDYTNPIGTPYKDSCQKP